MKLILFAEKIRQKIKNIYNKKLFKELIACPHSDFYLVDNVIVINRNIELGHNVSLYPGVMFFGDGPIKIGNNVEIGNNTIIYSSKNGGGVSIGDNTLIAAQCYIIDSDHGTESNLLIKKQANVSKPVTIGKDVWIAAGVKVLKGVNISDGCVIGAQSVVTKDIPQFSIAVGIPANVIRNRI